MVNSLNIFLSDNNYLSDFFLKKERVSNVLSVESIMDLNIFEDKKMIFKFYGVENHKVWREIFVPIAQKIRDKNNKYLINCNLFNYVPNDF